MAGYRHLAPPVLAVNSFTVIAAASLMRIEASDFEAVWADDCSVKARNWQNSTNGLVPLFLAVPVAVCGTDIY